MPSLAKVKRRISGLFSKKDKDSSTDPSTSTSSDGKLAPPSSDSKEHSTTDAAKPAKGEDAPTEPGAEAAATAPSDIAPANQPSTVAPDADAQAAAGVKTEGTTTGDKKDDTSPDADAKAAQAGGEEKKTDEAAGVKSGDKPVFDPKEVTVIFVLGGPGAGKGTQCAKLVEEFGFAHLSAGDLLRAEQEREGSEFGEMIKNHIKEGKIVPMEVTVKLLQNAMQEAVDTKDKKRFLIDGFPRKMDQAIKFDESVCPSSFVLFLTCPEDELLKRLLKRGETSGRADDNEESIKKRFKTFIDTSMPVVDYYREKNKVVEVESVGEIDDIYAKIKGSVEKELSKKTE